MTSQLPTSQKAIICLDTHVLDLINNAPIPSLQGHPRTLLVKVSHIALNPVDTKMVGPINGYPGAVSGFDFSGTIISLSPSLLRPWKIGDRVCGAVFGANPLIPDAGAFQQYLRTGEDMLLRVPEGMSMAEAATLGVGVGTAGLGLFRSLGVPGEIGGEEKGEREKGKGGGNVLVYGGSTATGTLALQFLKLAGLNGIAVCSEKNFPLAESYGAVKCFDYHSPTATADIKKYTKSSLSYVLDCITDASSMRFCYAVIGRTGGKYTGLEPYPEYLATRKSVKPDWVLSPELLGDVGWAKPFERKGNREMMEWGRVWMRKVQGLLDRGLLRAHPCRVMEGGLEGVLGGLEMLGRKEVSGVKLVYKVEQEGEE